MFKLVFDVRETNMETIATTHKPAAENFSSVEWTTGVDIWFFVGLFHKAIVQSGGMNYPWGYTGHLHSAIRFLKKHGHFKNVDEEVALEVLKLVTPEFMVELDSKICWTEYPVSSFYNIQPKNMKEWTFRSLYI